MREREKIFLAAQLDWASWANLRTESPFVFDLVKERTDGAGRGKERREWRTKGGLSKPVAYSPNIWLNILSKFTSLFFSRYLCMTLRTLKQKGSIFLISNGLSCSIVTTFPRDVISQVVRAHRKGKWKQICSRYKDIFSLKNPGETRRSGEISREIPSQEMASPISYSIK